MLSTSPTSSTSASLFTAVVIDEDHSSRMVRVRHAGDDTALTGWVRVAIPGPDLPQPGAEVVVAGELSDQAFVIGLLSPAPQRVTTSTGVSAEVQQSETGEESLRVRTPGNELLFEFSPATGVCRLNIPEGNLDVTTPAGGITFSAQGNVRIEGEHVSLTARQNLLLTVSRSIGGIMTSLRLLPRKARLASQQISVDGEEIATSSRKTQMTSEEISSTSTRQTVRTVSLNTTAETVTENSGNVYRTVRELVQLQAGRYRAFISGLSHFRSKKAFFSSDESMNIDGDQINIG